MITLKLLVLFVITNMYDISNGTYDVNVLNMMCKALGKKASSSRMCNICNYNRMCYMCITHVTCVTYVIESSQSLFHHSRYKRNGIS